MKSQDVMTRTVVTCSPLNSVSHAARLLLDNHISGMPVLDDAGTIVGMLTEGDLLQRSELGSTFTRTDDDTSDLDLRVKLLIKAHGWNVDSVMTKDVITIGPGTSLQAIAKLMMERGFKRVPVVDEGKLVGIVSRADLLECIAQTRSDHVPKTDECLGRAVRAHLQHDLGLTQDEAHATVSRGHVTLRGAVGSETLRRAAYVVADCVPGVAGVTNELGLSIAKPKSVSRSRAN